MARSVGMVGLVAVAALSSRPARASGVADAAATCRAPTLGPSVATQPAPWREAVDALVGEVASPGRPWSCPGGRVDLVAHEGGATLVVWSDDGRSTARAVATPDEVVPLGEALLAQPIPPPPPSAPGLAVAPPPPPAPPSVTPDAPPRALVSLTIGPRFGVPTNLAWGSATLTAVVPFAGFTAGAFARVDTLSARIDGAPLSMNAIAVGVTAGRAFAPSPKVELRASLAPSLAVVSAKQGTSGGPVDETRVDGRIGVELRGALALSRLFRGVVAIDADLAPRELGGGGETTKPRDAGDQNHDGLTARFPAFTVGLGVGVEITPR